MRCAAIIALAAYDPITYRVRRRVDVGCGLGQKTFYEEMHCAPEILRLFGTLPI